MRWLQTEWSKRLTVLAATAIWAIFIREVALTWPELKVSRWWVTVISAAVYIITFWLTDKAAEWITPTRKSKP